MMGLLVATVDVFMAVERRCIWPLTWEGCQPSRGSGLCCSCRHHPCMAEITPYSTLQCRTMPQTAGSRDVQRRADDMVA